MTTEKLPPAQPTYILRGHSSSIHTTTFIRQNTRLVTGDADGWVVVWDLVTKRAVAVWRAHEGVILGVQEWPRSRQEEEGRLITHGKDNLLLVWKLSESDESGMSTVLPVDMTAEARRKPWLVYSLEVNTMNFCSFACCIDQESSTSRIATEDSVTKNGNDGLLVAVPNILTSETVDVFQLPTCKRLYTIPDDPTTKTGLVMALSMFYHPASRNLTVVIGYESGHTMVSQLFEEEWKILYFTKCHDQPILGLDIDPTSKEWYLTSSADAVIGKHPIPDCYIPASETNSKKRETGSPISTAQPDSVQTINTSKQKPSLLSIALASSDSTTSSQTNRVSQTPPQEVIIQKKPLKINQTKHSGQQSLCIRSDGKIFATAGWDSKIRVYSTKTLKEVAMLKWHGIGCFAVDFANVNIGSKENGRGEEKVDGEEGGKELAIPSKSVDITRDIKLERLKKVKMTHWVAAGSKDGKISLWDIY